MTVRAVQFARFGGPEVLNLAEVPDPGAPVGDELLVGVEASSVNGTDLGLRRGDAKVATVGRMPFVPGFDLVGQVLRCGPEVTAFAPGDRVVALLGHGGGAQAEQVLLRQGRAALAPRTGSSAEAAALPLAGLTALQALYGRARLRGYPRPARVLVIGAAGGIGSFAVQLAKLAGAHVTGVASGPKLAHVTSLGADAVLDYRTHDVREVGERWDVVLDTPGAHSFTRLRGLLRSDGVVVSTRPVSADVFRLLAPWSRYRSGGRFTVVATRARSQDLAHLVSLLDRGHLQPALDSVFPLTGAAEAHRRAEGAATGKVVLDLTATEQA